MFHINWFWQQHHVQRITARRVRLDYFSVFLICWGHHERNQASYDSRALSKNDNNFLRISKESLLHYVLFRHLFYIPQRKSHLKIFPFNQPLNPPNEEHDLGGSSWVRRNIICSFLPKISINISIAFFLKKSIYFKNFLHNITSCKKAQATDYH